MTRHSGFTKDIPTMTPTQNRAHARALAQQTTCDTCGGTLIVYEYGPDLPIRWTHAEPTHAGHRPHPANENE